MKNPDIKLIEESFDKIYSTAVAVCKAYNYEYIPLVTLKDLLEQSKLKNLKMKGGVKFVKLYNNLIDVLYSCAESYCDENYLEGRFPLSVLDTYINHIKINL